MPDIYFKEEYGKIYELNGDGKLETFKIDGENGSVIYNFLKREIPIKLEENSYYDIITPYGYGGPLFSDYSDEKALEKLKNQFGMEFSQYCSDENIVSEFVRFHPIIKNHEFLKKHMEIIYNRDVVVEIFSAEEEKILESFSNSCRHATKKAKKNGIRVEITDDIDKFHELYIKTMERNNALDYYKFSKEFFRNTMKLLGDGAKIFSAYYGNKIISSSITIHFGEYMHAHFGGTDPEYRDLDSNNLIDFEVIKWGAKNGKKYYNLGGGYSDGEDSLYRYKKGFTKKESYQFYTGKKIYNNEIYTRLVQEREKEKDINDRDFFPLYRSR
ncbi:MAG: lipid II:glycine glycyltransferase FemX [Fusobacteriaceae bacterium]